VGDKILVTGTTTGALIQPVEEIRDDDGPVDTAERGMLIAVKTRERVRPNDKLYVLQNRSLSME
jgi:putative protease